MSKYLSIAVVAIALCLTPGRLAYGETTKKIVTISIVDVIDTDDCIVKRISINVPAGARIQLLNDTDQAQINSSPAGDGRPTVHLNVLADLMRSPDGKQSSLKVILNLAGGTSTRSEAVDAAQTLEQRLTFLTKPGQYPLGKRIPVLKQSPGRDYFLVVTMRQR